MSAAPLHDDVTPVPLCRSQDSLATAIARLTITDDWLLIWDEHPVGALPVAALLQALSPDSTTDWPQAAAQRLQLSLEKLLQQGLSQRLLPLQLIPAFWSQLDLQTYLHHCRGTIDQFQWILIDSDQRPLGRLPSPVLWNMAAADADSTHQVLEREAKLATLQQAHRLRSDYLAYISHELKNPITALLGLSELLVDSQDPAALSSRQQRYSELIRHNSLRLAAIASDILDLARVAMGHLQLSCRSVDLRALCEQAWQDVLTDAGYAAKFRRRSSSPFSADSADGDGGELPLVVPPHLMTLYADEQRLLQMLTQLLVNARLATAASGHLGITVADWGAWRAITVWDSGAEIPLEHQRTLLYSLQAMENPQTHSLEETGVGLVLTQRLADLHGGDVSFVSGPRGNRFTLLLPCDRYSGTGSSSEAQTPKGVSVLAETRIEAIEPLMEALEASGYGVVIARSGPEALSKIRRFMPQVVVLNPRLPELTGWDVLTLLKADQTTQKIPVILSLPSTSQSLASSADGVVVADQSQDVLVQTIKQIALSPTPHVNASPSSPEAIAMPATETLTVLFFNPPQPEDAEAVGPSADFNGLLHPYGYRVIEVEDPGQAGLVIQVWQPDVVLLGLAVPADIPYLRQLAQLPPFVRLPVVAIDPAIATAGHQAGLSVYPCLISSQALTAEQSPELSLLVQVIRVAALTNTTPHP